MWEGLKKLIRRLFGFREARQEKDTLQKGELDVVLEETRIAAQAVLYKYRRLQ